MTRHPATAAKPLATVLDDVWYENGRGLLFAGWYGAPDDGPRCGPFETRGEVEAALQEAAEAE